MRIDNWGMGQVLELPDHLLGRRYLVSCSVLGGDNDAAWDISEIAFPEMCVIWEVRLYSVLTGADIDSIRVAIGDQLPTSTAMVDALEPLLPGFGAQGPDPRVISLSLNGHCDLTRLRFGLRTAGRRLVLEVTGASGKTPRVQCGVVVSSVPKEIPEWMGLG